MKIITRQMKDRISQFKAERQRKIDEAAKDEAAKEAQQQQQQSQQPGVPVQVLRLVIHFKTVVTYCYLSSFKARNFHWVFNFLTDTTNTRCSTVAARCYYRSWGHS